MRLFMNSPALLASTLLAVAQCAPMFAQAMDTSPARPAISAISSHSPLGLAKVQIARKDWAGAIRTLEAVVKAEPDNADAHNLLGYSLRNNQRFDEALAAYGRALKIDPRHTGAHEYIGMAYIQMGQPAKAEPHLAALKDICGTSCEEYQDLQAALAKVSGPSASAPR